MGSGRSLPVIQSGGRQGVPPAFDRVGVVGLGGLGGAVAMAVRAAWPAALVIGVDRSDLVEQAIRSSAVDLGADDPFVLAEAGLVVLAAGRDEQERWLQALPDLLTGPAVITTTRADEGRPDASALPPHLSFVCGHACVAPAPAGVVPAGAERFAGARWLLSARDGDPASDRLAAFVRALGATPVFAPESDAAFLSILRPSAGPR
jgi:cyclohexadieny/prephenate dehydrogenase